MIDTEYLELQNAQCQLSGDKKAPNVRQRRKVQRKSVKCCQDPYQSSSAGYKGNGKQQGL